MATMIDGESYVGRVLIRPLSQSGDLRLYLWPLRCLKSRMGGPTFGIEVKGEEIRFCCKNWSLNFSQFVAASNM
jgi:hypothetical protein